MFNIIYRFLEVKITLTKAFLNAKKTRYGKGSFSIKRNMRSFLASVEFPARESIRSERTRERVVAKSTGKGFINY